MLQELTIRIILENPTLGVDFGIQQGKGSFYLTIQKQRAEGQNLVFEFIINTKPRIGESPDFAGSIVQGPVRERFIYIDIGTAAGQIGTPWSRRLKIPLKGITWEIIDALQKQNQGVLALNVQGTAKDGSPNCGTSKNHSNWTLM